MWTAFFSCRGKRGKSILLQSKDDSQGGSPAAATEGIVYRTPEGSLYGRGARTNERKKRMSDYINVTEIFGENVFKIGMTRRLDPQDRIDELSNASVPFKFDVHSFIFSEDAVSLENTLHQRLDSQRVNKITTRKEFFRCNIDDLEKLVYEIQPSASFIKTMLAEQYRMTLQIEKENISNM